MTRTRALSHHIPVGGSRVVEAELSRMVPVEHGRARRRTGTRTGRVELWIDVDALLRFMGTDALLSRGGKSQKASGAILVKRVDYQDSHTAEEKAILDALDGGA